MVQGPTLEGTLVVLPSLRSDVLDAVADEYERLLETHESRDILVLKRHPEGVEALDTALAAVDSPGSGIHRPWVEALPEHASKVIEEYDPQLDRLEYEERIALISMVIDGAAGSLTPYLARAREQDAFVRDVGQLLLEATRQRLGPEDADHPSLEALYRINERYHAELEDRGFVERPSIVPRAVELLEANERGVTERVTDGFDAVLAVEFQEFRALDRQYLAALTGGAELVCIGEPDASVERTRVESGTPEALADGLDAVTRDRPRNNPPVHAPLTRFLATGAEPSGGRLHRIRTDTRRSQDRAIAAEIQAVLDRRPDLSPEDIAVALPRLERVPPLRERLRAAGLPTDVVGTPALVEDPTIHELYALVTLQTAESRGGMAARGDHHELARQRLAARVEDLGPLLERCVDDRVRASIERWIVHSDLKGRIARTADWVDAREQFQSIDRILRMARFVESTDLVGPDWAGLERMLRRTIEFDARYVHDVDAQSPTGGVTVCSIDALPFGTVPVVFLADVLDRHYPGRSRLTELFPASWVREMPGLPAVIEPSQETLEQTFRPATRESVTGDLTTAYHANRSRRRLARGTRAATDRLYWCTYDREAGGLRRSHDPSRYLAMLEAQPAVTVESVADERPLSHGRANGIEAILETPRRSYDRLLRAGQADEPVSLTDIDAAYQELARTLEEDDLAPALRAAVKSRTAFAAGEVLRRD